MVVPVGALFVVGNSRSGTTMLAHMLSRHPEVHSCRELHFFEELWSAEDAGRRLARPEALDLAERLLHNARDWYHAPFRSGAHEQAAETVLARLDQRPHPHEVLRAVLDEEARRHGKRIACEQTPRNVFYIDDVLRLFPDAGVLSVIRDPRDVLLSQRNWWRRRFRGSGSLPLRTTAARWASYHPVTTSLLWRGGVRAADRSARHERVVTVRFEDLVTEPERELDRALGCFGLTFDPAMLEVGRISSSNRADVAGTGVDPGVVGRWRGQLSATEVWLSQRLTAAERAAHGYDALPVRPSAVKLLGHGLSLPAKTALAAALHGRRFGGLYGALRRRLTAGGTSARP